MENINLLAIDKEHKKVIKELECINRALIKMICKVDKK